ncbi:unnamed protein product [Urochloa decumbens]|uniref:Rx N-terminal domain-containing protein n=1 Tax=Urochloa decumbens TaxID=240449 RepID=A0ABC9BSY1_9POAL
MAPIVISAYKGVIGPLLDKLTKMMEDKYTNFIGVSNDIMLLRDELRTLNALLEKLEDTDELDPLVKAWRDQMREMGYDIEDFIDDFLHRAGSGSANSVFIDEISIFIKTLRDHMETAKHVKELKTHLKEINEQPKRYKFGELLANRPSTKEWEGIRDSIGIQESVKNATWERMRQILYLCYKDLPHHIRTCFLYLGIYPEDSEIRRNELISQWIAEGFVHNSHGQILEDVAKSYFSELLNRSLIQPANTNYGRVVSCRVHDVILDFILTLCTEANFISVAYTLDEFYHAEYKIRRLLLGPRIGDTGDTYTSISGTTAISLSHIRSLQLFGHSLPVLSSKYLRVLILETERVDLTAIGQLFQLRYLNVSAGAIELPTEIQGLQYLSTFQIFCINGITLPPDIFGLPRLSHLIVPLLARLPDGIGKTKSLCTVSGFDISDFQNVSDLGVLTNLRDLNLYRSKQVLTDTKIDALTTSLAKLCNLRNLCICSVGQWTHDVNDRLGSLSHPPSFHIEKLELIRWLLPRVPRWINGDLQNLIRLNLSVKETSTDEVRILGELPSLNDLYLWVQNCPQERGSIVFGPLGFPALEHLKIYCGGDLLSCLRFEAGVMPSLKKLTVSYMDHEWSGTAPVGIENLLNLREIQLFPSSDSGTVDKDRIRRAFTDVIEAHGRSLAGAALQVCYHPFPRTVAEDP